MDSKKQINNIKKFILIFFFFCIISSFLYENLYKEKFFLKIPTPDNKTYTLSFNNLELLKISLYGIIRNIDIGKELNSSEKIEYYSKEINELIAKNKDYYNFYYLEFQKIYPQRYFIFCIENSCDLFFFSIAGLVNVKNKNNLSIDDYLIIWIDEEYLKKMLELIKNRDKRILDYLKEGIIKGYFKVTNMNTLVENILKEYRS